MCTTGERLRLLFRGPMRVYPAVTLQLIFACARPNYSERWPDRLAVSGGPLPGYAIKQIVERVAPSTLIADDGSICRASPSRFASARQGKWIACEWNLPVFDTTSNAPDKSGS